MENSTQLQDAARNTWLKAVRSAGNDYRFFQYSDASKKADDMIHVPVSEESSKRFPREFHLLRSAFEWALINTDTDFVVKADHDMFVCSHHLSKILAQAPKHNYFMGNFWSNPCRADQNFHVYSRDLLQEAVEMTKKDLPSTWKENWAQTFGRIAKHLSVASPTPITFENDRVRIDSQQHWDVKPIDKIPEDYCVKKVAMHLFQSDFPTLDAAKKMYEFEDHERSYLAEVQGIVEPDEPKLEAPSCHKKPSSKACEHDWKQC